MVTTQSGTQTLEQAIVSALAAGEDDVAARLLRRAFGGEPGRGSDDLPELLEEFAEYLASRDRSEEAVGAIARAALLTAGADDNEDLLRRRCRIGEMLLHMGLPDEACAVYAGVAEQVPGQLWVHEAAGSDYVHAGDYEFAFAWLTAGLEQAVAAGDDPDCVARLLGLRRASMAELGLSRDDLDHEAAAIVARPHDRPAGGDDLLLLVELEGDGIAPGRAQALLDVLRRSSATVASVRSGRGSEAAPPHP